MTTIIDRGSADWSTDVCHINSGNATDENRLSNAQQDIHWSNDGGLVIEEGEFRVTVRLVDQLEEKQVRVGEKESLD